MIKSIEIYEGYNSIWVNYKDQLDLDLELHGRTYMQPSMSSFRRLLRAMNEFTKIKLYLDGYGFTVFAVRE